MKEIISMMLLQRLDTDRESPLTPRKSLVPKTRDDPNQYRDDMMEYLVPPLPTMATLLIYRSCRKVQDNFSFFNQLR
jgi:hypothetical protein